MKCRTIIVLAACLSLFALGGRASAEVIIDELFDANSVIESPLSFAMVGMSMMGMWMGGTTMAEGMWQAMFVPGTMDMYQAMGSVNMATGMDAGMTASWNSLVYFVGKPARGWGGYRVEFSFDYHTEDLPNGLAAKFGVYGWDGGETLNLESGDPSGGESPLIEGDLMNGFEWHTVEGNFSGDLDSFNFIGVTFTIGDTTADGEAVSLEIDNIKADAVPEPASMLLWAAATACVLGRIRKRRRAAGPAK